MGFMKSALHLVLLPQVAIALAAGVSGGLRGRASGSGTTCSDEVELRISSGTSTSICYSRGFLYRGGSCRESQDGTSCIDFEPLEDAASEVFIVASHVKTPQIVYYSGYVDVGDVFALKEGGDLPDVYNMTIYKDHSQASMLQTLVVEAPCYIDDFESLPAAPIQLAFTATEPSFSYQLTMQAKSTGQQNELLWRIQSLRAVEPESEEILPQNELAVFGGTETFVMHLDAPENTIAVVAQVVSSSGHECTLEARAAKGISAF